MVCCNCSVEFARNHFRNEVVTRVCLRADIMQPSPFRLLGTSTPSVPTGMLQLTIPAHQNTGTTVLLRAFLVGDDGLPCTRDILGATCSGSRCG
jgi:hypothetical protein